MCLHLCFVFQLLRSEHNQDRMLIKSTKDHSGKYKCLGGTGVSFQLWDMSAGTTNQNHKKVNLSKKRQGMNCFGFSLAVQKADFSRVSPREDKGTVGKISHFFLLATEYKQQNKRCWSLIQHISLSQKLLVVYTVCLLDIILARQKSQHLSWKNKNGCDLSVSRVRLL